jgi:hypothetical protein
VLAEPGVALGLRLYFLTWKTLRIEFVKTLDNILLCCYHGEAGFENAHLKVQPCPHFTGFPSITPNGMLEILTNTPQWISSALRIVAFLGQTWQMRWD